MMINLRHLIFAAFSGVLLVTGTQSAYAACSDPAGVAGEVVYNSSYTTMAFCDNTNWISMAGGVASGGGGGLTNGDKGDITVGGSGSTLTVDDSAITYAKIQDMSAAGKILGRYTSGAGNVQEITIGTGFSLSSDTLNVDFSGVGASSSGTAGYVQFSGGSGTFSSDSASGGAFFWDSTNHRLGIGTATPWNALSVAGDAAVKNLYLAQDNTSGTPVNFVSFNPYIWDTTAGSESGGFSLRTKNNGSDVYITDFDGSSIWNYVPVSNRGYWSYFIRDGNNAYGPYIYGQKSRGSYGGTLAAVQSGDDLLNIYALPYNGTNWNNASSGITFTATQNHTTSAAGSKIQFGTTANNTTANLWRMIINQDGNVSIGNNVADASALLDVQSTTKGFLPPRMTTSQISLIGSPAEGLLAYDLTTHELKLRTNSAWIALASGAASSSGTAGYVQVSGGSGAFASSGTTAGQQFFWDNTNKRLGIGTATPALNLHVVGNAMVGTPGTASNHQTAFDFVTLDGAANGLGNAATRGWSFYARGNAWTTAAEQNDLGLSYWNGTTWNTALAVDSLTGNIGIGSGDTTAPLTVASGTAQYPRAVLILPSSHATSRRTELAVDNWSFMQDGAGDGTKNFQIWQGSAGASRLFISTTGNIGIGTTSPNVKLDVAGAIVSRAVNLTAGTSVDFSAGNVAYTTAACGAFTLSNMQDGGSYTLVVKGSGTGPATFTHTGMTVKTTGTLACTSAKHTVFSFLRAGTDVYVSMVTGY